MRLYDARAFDKGPFKAFRIPTDAHDPPPANMEACCVKFSPDGRHILLPTRHHGIILLDAFQGDKVKE